MQHSISQDDTLSSAKLTRVLLICGVVAGPLFTIVGLTPCLYSLISLSFFPGY